MGVDAAQLGSAAVHQVHEGADAAGDAVGDDVAGLVGAVHHSAVQQIPVADDLAGADVGGAGIRVQPRQTVVLGGDHLVKADLAPLQGLDGQEHGHDLGQAGRGALLVGVFRIQKPAGLQIGQDDGLGAVQRRLVQRAGARRKNAEEQTHDKN